MNMNISKRDKKLLLYVGGILLLVLVYFLFYRNMSDSNKAIEREISTLTAERDRLTLLNEHVDEYKEDTEKMKNDISTILLKFPADIREEDTIVYANGLEMLSGMQVSNIEIGSKLLLYSTGQGASADTDAKEDTAQTGTADQTEDTAQTQNTMPEGPVMHLYDVPVEYSFTVDYPSFKKAVELIMQNPDKRNMDSLTLTYDSETGKLLGTAMVNMYYVIGTDSEYEIPQLLPIPQGLDDIFGTVSSGAPADTQEDTEEDSTEEDGTEEDTEEEDDSKESR